jgi:hypothetical protein
MGYLNPLLKLPAGRALLALTPEQRAPIEAVLRELRDQANIEAENAWRRRKPQQWRHTGGQSQRTLDI